MLLLKLQVGELEFCLIDIHLVLKLVLQRILGRSDHLGFRHLMKLNSGLERRLFCFCRSFNGFDLTFR